MVERLRPHLRAFRDEDGRELFDMPGRSSSRSRHARSPPRFLPEYDNVLLSHADRSRIVSDEVRSAFSGGGPVHGTVLLDGMLLGPWHLERDGRETATLHVDHAVPLTKRLASALRAEGLRALSLLAADASAHDVRLAARG